MKAAAPDVRRKQNAMSIIRYLHKIAETLRLERPPWDGRPVLMMEDQKGKI